MNIPEPNGTLPYRVGKLEEEVRDLKAANIALIADRVRILTEDQRDFRAQVRGEMARQEKVFREGMAGTDASVKEVRDELVGNRRAQYVGLFGLVGVFVGVALTFAYG